MYNPDKSLGYQSNNEVATVLLTKDQKLRQAEVNRFHMNLKNVQNILSHELIAISAFFRLEAGVLKMEPTDIAYFVEAVTHASIEKRKAIENAGCRYEMGAGDDPWDITVYQALARISNDGVDIEGCRIPAGQGLLHYDFKTSKAYVRSMADDFKPSADVPYPFLILIE